MSAGAGTLSRVAWKPEEPVEVVPRELVEAQLTILANAVTRESHDSYSYLCRCAKCCDDRARRIRARAALLERIR